MASSHPRRPWRATSVLLALALLAAPGTRAQDAQEDDWATGEFLSDGPFDSAAFFKDFEGVEEEPYEPGPEELDGLLGIAHRLRTGSAVVVDRGMNAGDVCRKLAETTGIPFELSEAMRARTLTSSFNSAGDAVETMEKLTTPQLRFLVLPDRVRCLGSNDLMNQIAELEDTPLGAEVAEVRDRVVVHWRAPRETRSSMGGWTLVNLTGRLGYRADSGQVERMTWKQQVIVLLAREPETLPTWGRGRANSETYVATANVQPDGSFSVALDVEEIRRVPGKTVPFLAALCLPDLEVGGFGRQLVRPLPQGITTLPIPGPPVLSETLRIINGVSSPTDRHFDPPVLVRAVNHLHALGKERALAALEEYLALVDEYPRWDDWRRDPANLDTGDQASVFLIVRLLFEPLDPTKGHPSFGSGFVGRAVPDYPGGRYPIVLVDDVPFLVAAWLSGRSGYDSDPRADLAWASEHGRLRESPLRPADDLFATLDKARALLGPSMLQSASSREYDPERDLRTSTWIAVEHLVGMPFEEECLKPFYTEWKREVRLHTHEIGDAAWAGFCSRVRKIDIVWDPEAQAYTTR